MRPVRLLAVVLLGLGPVPLAASPASAHDERPTRTLDGTGHVPSYRTAGPTRVVCTRDRADFAQRIAAYPAQLKATNEALWSQCLSSGYATIQEAVDSIDTTGVTIKVLPGVYRELPSLTAPSEDCANLTGIGRSELYHYDVLSLDQQRDCPQNQNLVAVIDKHDLQLEGTGAAPTDVVIDGQYQKLNVLRADNADGFYLRNLTAQRSQFNAVYIMETDGFVIDTAVGRWNDEYGFLTFAVDHGLYTHAEGYGNGDSAFYPGAASDLNKDKGYDVPRYAVEIRDSYAHHNMLGYSGTAGDSVWVHDSMFTNNSTGISTDSAFPHHPGMPQNHSLFEHNVIADNNTDYNQYGRDGTCTKPYAERGYERGVVCPVVPVPVGAGVINPGGNYNIWRENHIYGNHYAGFLTSWVPGVVRAADSIPEQFDTSHHNRYLRNHMGVTKDGAARPNGVDYWWDGQGVANCWTTAADSVGVSTNVGPLPSCGPGDRPTAPGISRYVGEPVASLKLVDCAAYNLSRQQFPSGCDWFGAYAARGLERTEVRIVLVESVVVTLLLAGVALRLRSRASGWLAFTATAAGFAFLVAGTWRVDPRLDSVGLLLVGIGFAAAGILLGGTGRRKAGLLTWGIALFAILGAVDHGLVPVPYIPVAPSLVRLLLELLWALAALGVILRGPRRMRTREEEAGSDWFPTMTGSASR